MSLLGKFISVREPNIKYLGLENMVRLAEVPAVADTINRCKLLLLMLLFLYPSPWPQVPDDRRHHHEVLLSKTDLRLVGSRP